MIYQRKENFVDKLVVQHLPLADQIIILGDDGRIAEQGSWDNLRVKAGYISQLVLEDRHRHPKETASGNGNDEETKILSPAPKKKAPNMPDSTRKTGDIRLYSKNREVFD